MSDIDSYKKLEDILAEIESKAHFSKELFKICNFNKAISDILHEDELYISEFVIAKISGLIPNLHGHPEITHDIVCGLSDIINMSHEILADSRREQTYLIVNKVESVIVVVKVKRLETGKTEVMTIYGVGEREQKRLEHKHPVFLIS